MTARLQHGGGLRRRRRGARDRRDSRDRVQRPRRPRPALATLGEMGVEVPEQLSVVGIDDIPLSRFAAPPLTTMSVPRIEIGRQAWQRTAAGAGGRDGRPSRSSTARLLVARRELRAGIARERMGRTRPPRAATRIDRGRAVRGRCERRLGALAAAVPGQRASRRAGTPLSVTEPTDHPHHLGVSLAIPDVNGTSYWGGRTYVRGEGSIMVPNQGRQRRDRLRIDGHSLDERLSWVDHTGITQLIEVRELRLGRDRERVGAAVAEPSQGDARRDHLRLAGDERPRDGAGYGGIFWRFAPEIARVFSPAGDTEREVHGAATPWLAFTFPERGTTVVLRAGRRTAAVVRAVRRVPRCRPVDRVGRAALDPRGRRARTSSSPPSSWTEELADAPAVERALPGLRSAGRAVTAPLRVGIAGIHGHGRSHVDAVLALAADVETRRGRRPARRRRHPTDDAACTRCRRDDGRRGARHRDPEHPHPHARRPRGARARGGSARPAREAAGHRRSPSTTRCSPRPARQDARCRSASNRSGAPASPQRRTLSLPVSSVRSSTSVRSGLWSRSEQYWRRSAWAGKRRDSNGGVVADGAVTNPLAHALATSLVIAGAREPDDVRSIQPDLRRANDIDTDDTSSLIIELASGLRLAAALSVTAPRRHEPYVLLQGEPGTRAVLLHARSPAGASPRRDPCPAPTSSLAPACSPTSSSHVRAGTALAVPLGGHRSVHACAGSRWWHRRPRGRWAPITSPSSGAATSSSGLCDGIEAWSERVAWEGRTFSELGAPW